MTRRNIRAFQLDSFVPRKCRFMQDVDYVRQIAVHLFAEVFDYGQ